MRCFRGVVMVVLAACGGGKSTVDGAVPGDSDPATGNDAAIPIVCPTAPTTGQLVTLQLGAAGLPVLWHEPDGALRACTQTDANGHTEMLIEPGSGVSWVTPIGSSMIITTYLGIQPGEALNFGAVPTTTTLPKIRVTYDSAYSGASRYMFDLGCAGTSYAGSSGYSSSLTPPDFGYFPVCIASDGQHVNLYAEAVDSQVSAAQLAYAIASNVALTPPLTQVTMGPWRTDFVDAPVTLTNVPFASQNHLVYLGWTTGGVDFNDGIYSLSGGAIAAGGSSTLTGRKLPAVLPDAMVAQIRLTDADGNVSFTFVESPGAVGARTFDMATAYGAAKNVTNTFSGSETRPMVSWQADSALQGGDAVMIQLRYADNSRWNVFSAPDQLSLRFPQLPDTYAALRPLNVNLIDHRLYYFDIEGVTGYTQVRASTPPFPLQFRGRQSLTYF